MMTPRELQAIILADTECAPFVHTNEMEPISGAEARQKDGAIAAILNRKGVGRTSRAVQAWEAKKLLIKRGRWRQIVLASQQADHPAVEPAYAAVALAEDARMSADFQDPAAGPLLSGLVDAGLLTTDDVDQLRALCDVPSMVTAEQVSLAVRGPWGDESQP